jgi:hypothetical protein
MKIKLVKFGEILTSRSAGREAGLSIKAYQRPKANEKIELDFDGVLSIGPSWLGEVLDLLYEEYGKARVVLMPAKNRSVIETVKILDASASK